MTCRGELLMLLAYESYELIHCFHLGSYSKEKQQLKRQSVLVFQYSMFLSSPETSALALSLVSKNHYSNMCFRSMHKQLDCTN